MTDVAQEPEMVTDGATKFSMRNLPLLSGGAVSRRISIASNLWLGSKVYSTGGENALHAHQGDDHAFFVLQGGARFYDADGTETEVGPLEGVLIPRGVTYRFQSIPPENLVMLRMAGAEGDYFTMREGRQRLAPDGSVLEGKDPRNGTPAMKVVETGQYFAPGTPKS